ncbi:hypothetical protein NQ317_007755, partial [Molorchus minor]
MHGGIFSKFILPNKKYICYHCSKDYTSKFNLIRHISKCTSGKCTKDVECVLCKNYTYVNDNILNHYRIVHNINVITEDFCLPSFLEFEKWKDAIEENTVS